VSPGLCASSKARRLLPLTRAKTGPRSSPSITRSYEENGAGFVAYGATDDIGFQAVENRMSIHDLHATLT
jgi:hypothetical protein